jgi:hypothetical protein
MGTLKRMELTICLQIGFHLFISENQFDRLSLVQLNKAVIGAASRVAKRASLQQSQGEEQQFLMFGLGGSTPIIGEGLGSGRRKHVVL